MAESQLAYRFREANARKYETQIARIVEQFPHVVVFHPENVETFSCRLRDAIRSFRENKWPTTIDLERLTSIRLQVVIRARVVLAGSKEEIGNWTGETPTRDILPPPQSSPQGVITNPDERALESLMELHHQRILTTPTLVRIDSRPFDKAHWEARYDVSIEPVEGEQNSYKIL